LTGAPIIDYNSLNRNGPMTYKQLSPAAQDVLDAFLGDAENTGLQMDDLRENVAAALRAAADQVVPEESEPSEQPFADPNDPWPTWHANKKTRRKLLNIATELKAL
jgi:hypothetical protein